MSDWVPLLQSLIWPIFVAALLVYGRNQVKDIMNQIAARIKAGASLQVGTGGFVLGQSENKLTRLDDTENLSLGAETDPSIHPQKSPSRKKESESDHFGHDNDDPTQYAKVAYLVHAASAPQVDSDGIERRAIRVIVDADSPEILNKIECVVYHLHPTFHNPNREVSNRHSNFELATRAWGEFNLYADVYFRNYRTPLTLFRYVNF